MPPPPPNRSFSRMPSTLYSFVPLGPGSSILDPTSSLRLSASCLPVRSVRAAPAAQQVVLQDALDPVLLRPLGARQLYLRSHVELAVLCELLADQGAAVRALAHGVPPAPPART